MILPQEWGSQEDQFDKKLRWKILWYYLFTGIVHEIFLLWFSHQTTSPSPITVDTARKDFDNICRFKE